MLWASRQFHDDVIDTKRHFDNASDYLLNARDSKRDHDNDEMHDRPELRITHDEFDRSPTDDDVNGRATSDDNDDDLRQLRRRLLRQMLASRGRRRAKPTAATKAIDDNPKRTRGQT